MLMCAARACSAFAGCRQSLRNRNETWENCSQVKLSGRHTVPKLLSRMIPNNSLQAIYDKPMPGFAVASPPGTLDFTSRLRSTYACHVRLKDLESPNGFLIVLSLSLTPPLAQMIVDVVKAPIAARPCSGMHL